MALTFAEVLAFRPGTDPTVEALTAAIAAAEAARDAAAGTAERLQETERERMLVADDQEMLELAASVAAEELTAKRLAALIAELNAALPDARSRKAAARRAALRAELDEATAEYHQVAAQYEERAMALLAIAQKEERALALWSALHRRVEDDARQGHAVGDELPQRPDLAIGSTGIGANLYLGGVGESPMAIWSPRSPSRQMESNLRVRVGAAGAVVGGLRLELDAAQAALPGAAEAATRATAESRVLPDQARSNLLFRGNVLAGAPAEPGDRWAHLNQGGRR